MKTLSIALFTLFCANTALARPAAEFVPNYDSLALIGLLVVGLVCLVVARRRTV